MRILLTAAAIVIGAAALSGCETMSEDQCLAGDWIGRGYQDGQNGAPTSRINDYAQACSQYGVSPDPDAYHRGWREGVVQYCRPSNGFDAGRRGNAYHGVCAGLPYERDFVMAYEDGRTVYDAEQAVSSARSTVDRWASELTDLDGKIAHFERETRNTSLTDQQRDHARNRVTELRRERRDAEREWRRSQDALDDAERYFRDIRRRFGV